MGTGRCHSRFSTRCITTWAESAHARSKPTPSGPSVPFLYKTKRTRGTHGLRQKVGPAYCELTVVVERADSEHYSSPFPPSSRQPPPPMNDVATCHWSVEKTTWERGPESDFRRKPLLRIDGVSDSRTVRAGAGGGRTHVREGVPRLVPSGNRELKPRPSMRKKY